MLRTKREKELAAVQIQEMVHRKWCLNQHRFFMERMEERMKSDSRILQLEESSKGGDSWIEEEDGVVEQMEQMEQVERGAADDDNQKGKEEEMIVGEGSMLESSIVEETEVVAENKVYENENENENERREEVEREGGDDGDESDHKSDHENGDESGDIVVERKMMMVLNIL